jgi:hypothetical protein
LSSPCLACSHEGMELSDIFSISGTCRTVAQTWHRFQYVDLRVCIETSWQLVSIQTQSVNQEPCVVVYVNSAVTLCT